MPTGPNNVAIVFNLLCDFVYFVDFIDYSVLTPQNLSIEICVQKFFSIHIYVKIALTKKKKK